MRARTDVPISEKRMLSISEAAAYCGLGINSARAFFVSIGALRKCGRRSLYDRQIIDAALDRGTME